MCHPSSIANVQAWSLFISRPAGVSTLGVSDTLAFWQALRLRLFGMCYSAGLRLHCVQRGFVRCWISLHAWQATRLCFGGCDFNFGGSANIDQAIRQTLSQRLPLLLHLPVARSLKNVKYLLRSTNRIRHMQPQVITEMCSSMSCRS